MEDSFSLLVHDGLQWHCHIYDGNAREDNLVIGQILLSIGRGVAHSALCPVVERMVAAKLSPMTTVNLIQYLRCSVPPSTIQD